MQIVTNGQLIGAYTVEAVDGDRVELGREGQTFVIEFQGRPDPEGRAPS
ncbi:MAG: hypothetical protein KJO18_03720 [Acidimicrobiia bacterium]|nr:hypothetical protein [Acidimicrobiia bacterium]